jgi:hypothetical protein
VAQALSTEWSQQSVALQREEAEFRAAAAAKDRETEHYAREVARLQELGEALGRRLLEQRAEVQVYDRCRPSLPAIFLAAIYLAIFSSHIAIHILAILPPGRLLTPEIQRMRSRHSSASSPTL